MQARLSRIDDLTRPDHTFLQPTDECYYLGEYTARKGFSFSPTNNLINNLKKPMDRRDKPEWRYKEQAISEFGRMLGAALNPEWLRTATIVPTPPSKVKTDAEYDDRLIRIVQVASSGVMVDLRELVVLTKSLEAAHLKVTPRSIQELVEVLVVDESSAVPEPASIGIIDDMLTTGAHFKALQQLLTRRFPEVPVVGIFLARRVPLEAEH